jgi:hypothetical protein
MRADRPLPRLGPMIDALRARRRSYLAALLQEARGWPDRGRARRDRFAGRIANDWFQLTKAKEGTKMKFSEAFPSRFLKSEHIEGERTLTIRSVERCDDPTIDKPIVRFDGLEQPLVLNVTNGRILASALGNDMDAWVGTRIVLYVALVPFEGKIVNSIRVRVPQPKAPSASKKKAASLGALIDDDLPL